MPDRERQLRVVETNLAEHPATTAWSKVLSTDEVPRRIVTLKEERKTAVYRLHGLGPNGSIIAKRAKRERAVVERHIYELVLSRLSLSRLDFYGFLDERDSGFSWLFLEDAGDRSVSGDVAEHRRLAIDWLSGLHTRSWELEFDGRLPDRGPTHYLRHIHEARQRILESLGNEAIGRELRGSVEIVLAELDTVESRWPSLSSFCSEMPRVLVHGDFVEKNLRWREVGPEVTLLALDWEEAGWGIPAPDLANWTSDIDDYWLRVRPTWDRLDRSLIYYMGFLGKVFRAVASVNWESYSLGYPWADRRMLNMKVIASLLRRMTRTPEWQHVSSAVG